MAIPTSTSPSKLLFVARFDRDGIAWHHLGPHEIVHVTASIGGEPLKPARMIPNRWHEQAGGWSWILHEFDVQPGAASVALNVEAAHPKSVAVTMDVWNTDA